MTSLGRVQVWDDEEGCGVIASDATPGGCWAHYSDILLAGFRTLRTGEDVEFAFEEAKQDGYAFRAVGVWPADADPVRTDRTVVDPSPAYRSTLTLAFDSPGEDTGNTADTE